MADFCRQCQVEVLCLRPEETQNEYPDRPKPEPGKGYPQICEGCGFTLVDGDGNCIADDCLVDHKTGKSRSGYADRYRDIIKRREKHG